MAALKIEVVLNFCRLAVWLSNILCILVTVGGVPSIIIKL